VNSESLLPPGYLLRPFDRVESTNDEARRLAEQGAEAGMVVVADQQLKGRGRHGRVWQSPPGNLYASLLLRPDCTIAQSAQLSLVASLALAEAVIALAPPGVDVRVKWPNDVLVRGAKVAGLLLESTAGAGERVAWVVVGSGVNIKSAPADTPYPATALAHEGFPPLAPLDLLVRYLTALDGWLARWRVGGFAAVRPAWLALGCAVGDRIRLRLAGEELAGRFLDVTDQGALLVGDEGDRRRQITAGELIYPAR
jgi:BirA family transcriptional regulator, biotin operon repressor / biotin---[acetyl-CoA-carboxylase] ligase